MAQLAVTVNEVRTVLLGIPPFSSFSSRLSAQVALCNWPNAQERETLKDLFIGRIRDVDVQERLIKAKADLDDTFKLALECERVQARLLNSKN